MRFNFLKFLLFLFIGCMAGGYYLSSKNSEFIPGSQQMVCGDKPVTFYIDSIDPRFGVSKEQVKQAFEEGAEAWSAVAGKPLAVYHEKGTIPIRLIYDERQQLVDSELSFRKKIRNEEIRIENMEREFRQDSVKYEQRLTKYDNAVQAAQDKIENLNEWVESKNEAGGLREEEIEEFEQRKSAIDQLEQQFSREDQELESLANQLNQKIDRLNRTIDEKNNLVEQYNKRYAGNQKFTQGTYAKTKNQQAISIHQFSGVNELRLVLAHELGHALGLDHVQNPQSVMYHEMTIQSRSVLSLTEEDRDAIQRLCGN